MKLAIVDREKCKPAVCGRECKKYCPVEKQEVDSCVVVGEKCVIDEHACVGCSICVKRCPFGALDVVNLPSVNEKDIVHRYFEILWDSMGQGFLELLKQRGEEGKIKELAELLGVSQVLENKMDKLSGGELQRVAILAASLGEADVYFFDEPLAFLDIGERLRVSDYLREMSKDKTLIVVEHDLLILDYLTDYLNVFFGGQGAFGLK